MSESENTSLQEQSQENQYSLSSNFQELALEEPSLKEVSDSSSNLDEKMNESANLSVQFDSFKHFFEEASNPEIKLELAINFMETSLSQGGTPHFRSFWEARRFALPLFKEAAASSTRNLQWSKLRELSKEARRLKEILDEQSAFAVEQIEIAIQALESQISQENTKIDKNFFPENFVMPHFLKEKNSQYIQLQNQLNLLNLQASHINALRKELLKTEMRIRQKNKFFQRLSCVGDQIFPKRKEVIKELSAQFLADVEQFIETSFASDNMPTNLLYVMREEIKSLQALAKILTLNTQSFNQTRIQLSKCWDKIKVEEREKKKERSQQRTLFKQNEWEIQQSLQTIKQQIENKELTTFESLKKVDDIVLKMRKVDLGREELKRLREELAQVRKNIHDQRKDEDAARSEAEENRLKQKKELFLSFKNESERLLSLNETSSIEQLLEQRDQLIAQVQESSLSKLEKQEIERLLKPLKDIIAEKKEKILLELSDDDRQTLNQFKTILTQRKERRQEIKNQIDELRRQSAVSGLDFEKAMNLNAQLTEERERLEKVNQGIQEIELKIQDLQKKIV